MRGGKGETAALVESSEKGRRRVEGKGNSGAVGAWRERATAALGRRREMSVAVPAEHSENSGSTLAHFVYVAAWATSSIPHHYG